MGKIQLTIDDQKVSVDEGASVLEAARAHGIYVPTLCHSPTLAPYGGCRMCIVEIEGTGGLPTACTTGAADGMVVRTDTEKVNRVRRMVCEMLIADHPADCLSCSSNQRCELQKVASHLGVSQKRLGRIERESIRDESNPFFTRDLSKCILCGLCVRTCQELRQVGAIEIAGRGGESRVAPFADAPIEQSTCDSCGACVDICPVAALSAKAETLPPTREVRTTCPYCGCGCGMVLGVRGGRIVRVRGEAGHPASGGSLCVKVGRDSKTFRLSKRQAGAG